MLVDLTQPQIDLLTAALYAHERVAGDRLALGVERAMLGDNRARADKLARELADLSDLTASTAKALLGEHPPAVEIYHSDRIQGVVGVCVRDGTPAQQVCDHVRREMPGDHAWRLAQVPRCHPCTHGDRTTTAHKHFVLRRS